MRSETQNLDVVRCFCGIAKCNTSWMNSNPGRRFWGCERYRGSLDNGCGFFCWYDPPICERSKKVIPGLLRRIRELESRVEDGMHSEVHGFSDSVISSGRVWVEDEANSRLRVDKRWKEKFCWFVLGLLCVVIGLILGLWV